MSIKLNTKYSEDFVSKTDLESIAPEIKKAHKTLTEKSGAGNDFLGWIDLPVDSTAGCALFSMMDAYSTATM